MVFQALRATDNKSHLAHADEVMSSTTTSRLAGFLATTKSEELNKSGADADADSALVLRISHQDRDALADLFRRYARYVRGIAYKVLRDEGEAADLVQEVFVLIYRIAGQFDRSKGTARSWIAQIAFTRALTRRRQLTSRQHYTHLGLDRDAERVLDTRRTVDHYEDSLEATFGRKALIETFNSLSENQRETLRLFFFEGLTLSEIAIEIGQSRDNVKHYYVRGLDRLRRRLKIGTETV